MNLMVTKEKVLEAAKTCVEGKKVLQAMFPEVFEPEWEDVTEEITLFWDTHHEDGYNIHIRYKDEDLAFSNGFTTNLRSMIGDRDRFKFKHYLSIGGDPVLKVYKKK